MQVPTIPPPIIASALPQDVVTKAVPNVQAMAPLVQNAVDPTPKAEKSTSYKEKEKGRNPRRDQSDDKERPKDGHAVNISV